MLSRRSFIAGGVALSTSGLLARPGRAAVARALTLKELVAESAHALVGVPVDAFGQWEKIGDRERIVTFTTLQVQEPIDGREVSSQALTVRTLGGVVGDVGQVVPGETTFVRGEPAAVFLAPITDGLFAVTGMSQGHYRLLPDGTGTRRLRASHAAALVHADDRSAVRRLHQLTVGQAEALVRKALADAR